MNCKETARFLRERDNYLILTHKRPDGDTIGCAAALMELLRGMGKTAWLLENRDATKLFQEYLEGRTAPADFVPDTVVSVDVASLGLLPPNADPYKGRIDLAIDHHPSQEFFARETWLESDKAACGELVYALAAELDGLSQAVAIPLYVAVSTDTGCFVYSNTTANTHRVAAELMAAEQEALPRQDRGPAAAGKSDLTDYEAVPRRHGGGGPHLPGDDGPGPGNRGRRGGHRRLRGPD